MNIFVQLETDFPSIFDNNNAAQIDDAINFLSHVKSFPIQNRNP